MHGHIPPEEILATPVCEVLRQGAIPGMGRRTQTDRLPCARTHFTGSTAPLRSFPQPRGQILPGVAGPRPLIAQLEEAFHGFLIEGFLRPDGFCRKVAFSGILESVSH
jgi:hypothetical protein